MEAGRRLSPLDATFLYFERPYQRLHVGCVALLDGPLPFPAFVEAMAARLGSIPRYRQRPVRPVLDLDWPRWEDDPDFDVRHHLRHVAVPAPGGEAELHELIDTLFATPIDEAHPLWENYLIDGLADGRAALLCKVHHAMIDGVSGAQVLEAMADPPPAANGEPRPAPAAAPRAREARTAPSSGWWDALRTVASPRTLLGRTRDAIAAARTLSPLFLEPISDLPFTGRLTDARRIVWASFPLDDFLAVRGAAGCKVNDVVLAVIAGALRRYVEARGVSPDGLRVRTLVPMSLRRSEDHMTLGNLVTSMFPTLPIGIADPVERLRHMADEMRELKERGQAQAAGTVMQLLGSLPAPFGALLGRMLPDRSLISTVCTNVPGPREACRLLGRRIVEVHPIVPLFQNMGLEFAILSYAGNLSIAAACEPHLVPDADTIPHHLAAALAELKAALDATTRRETPAVAGPRVGDLMTRAVVTIGEHASLIDAYATMRERRIRHLPVVDGAGRLAGLVTHRDLLAASSSSLTHRTEAQRLRLLAGGRAAEVMETHLTVTTPDEPAGAAGDRMMQHKIGCLPVIDREARVVGIVTEEDFLRWATGQMAAPQARASA